MVNEEQLEILKKGVELWNKWRAENRDVYVDHWKADLGGADLREVDLSGAKLYGADLSGAVLSGAKLRGADLSEAIFRAVDLREVDLSGAKLYGADLSGANPLFAHNWSAALQSLFSISVMFVVMCCCLQSLHYTF